MNTVLGRWIAALRLDCGLTRGKLAEHLGVPASTVARWESENETVPAEVLGALAEALHVPLDDLLALHASSRRLKTSIPARTRRIATYPVQGTLDEMLELGGRVASSLALHLERKLTRRVYNEVLERFPRDSALQLLFTHHLIAFGAHPRKARLLDLGCTLLITQRRRKVYDGERQRYALVLPIDDWVLVLVPQVPVGVPGCPKIHRIDFLALYADSYGHRQWIDLSVEDAPLERDEHADCPSLLGIPRLGYDSAHVCRPDMVALLVSDVRRYMTSDVVHANGVVTLRIRQPARLDPPPIRRRRDPEPS